MQAHDQVWGFGVGPRVMIGVLVAFTFGLVVLLFALPAIVRRSDPTATLMIDALAVVMLAFGIFYAFGLTAIVRTRIALDGSTLRATVPSHHNLLLVPFFRSIALPVTDIAAVEQRQEAVRSWGLTTLRDSLSIVTVEGERIGLFSDTAGPSLGLPLDDIAAGIAGAAHLEVTQAPMVWSRAPGLYGAASSSWSETPLDASAAANARRIATLTAQICAALILLVFVLRACS